MLPGELKTLFNLPAEVPDTLLSRHLESAERDLRRDSGATPELVPEEVVFVWEEALAYLAYSYAVPFLNTFTLQGAARAERLAVHLDARFLDNEEQSALIGLLRERYQQLLAVIQESVATDEPETGGIPGMQWVAI
jgi:hypothetical protein